MDKEVEPKNDNDLQTIHAQGSLLIRIPPAHNTWTQDSYYVIQIFNIHDKSQDASYTSTNSPVSVGDVCGYARSPDR